MLHILSTKGRLTQEYKKPTVSHPQKTIKKLPESFHEDAMRISAAMRCGYRRRCDADIGGDAMTSNNPITAIVDATIFTLPCYEERMVKLKKIKRR